MIWMTREEDQTWTLLVLVDESFDLLSLPGRLREVLTSPDFESELGKALFPQAYRRDPLAEADYQGLMRGELIGKKLECLEQFEKNIQAAETIVAESEQVEILHVRLTDEDLSMWLGFLHDLRLLIGTGLGIEDESWMESLEPDSPRLEECVLMERIAHLEGAIIRALRATEGFGEPDELSPEDLLDVDREGDDGGSPLTGPISEDYDLDPRDGTDDPEEDTTGDGGDGSDPERRA